jgi:hypothetical protein
MTGSCRSGVTSSAGSKPTSTWKQVGDGCTARLENRQATGMNPVRPGKFPAAWTCCCCCYCINRWPAPCPRRAIASSHPSIFSKDQQRRNLGGWVELDRSRCRQGTELRGSWSLAVVDCWWTARWIPPQIIPLPCSTLLVLTSTDLHGCFCQAFDNARHPQVSGRFESREIGGNSATCTGPQGYKQGREYQLLRARDKDGDTSCGYC